MIWLSILITVAVVYYPIAYVFGWNGADDGTIAAGCLFVVVSVLATVLVFAAWVNEGD